MTFAAYIADTLMNHIASFLFTQLSTHHPAGTGYSVEGEDTCGLGTAFWSAICPKAPHREEAAGVLDTVRRVLHMLGVQIAAHKT